ncbi:MAG: cupin domain-containing protein [Synechococcaceae cyanobacterium]
MNLHPDLSQPVALDTGAIPWTPSPMAGGGAAGGGEEILVLEGVFQDAQGSYGPGGWLRNPPGSRHRPWSEAGCTVWSG